MSHHDHMAHMAMMNGSGGLAVAGVGGGHEHGEQGLIPDTVLQSSHANTNHHMDHNTQDHSAVMNDTCSSMSGHAGHHMMSMAFHGGFCETILFDFWKISTIGGLIGSCIGIIIMSALYEGLKYYREYLFWKSYNALQYRSVSMPQEKNVVNDENRIVHMVGEIIHKQPPTMLSWMHAFQTLLHIVQIILSYFLMLIFMTFNVWLCTAVVIGAAIGYFLFGWKKSVIVDVTEHCH